MCGIVGFTGIRENRERILKSMTDAIAHRGPDGEGFYVNGENENQDDSRKSPYNIIDFSEDFPKLFKRHNTVLVKKNKSHK